jgi:hypothetical protein
MSNVAFPPVHEYAPIVAVASTGDSRAEAAPKDRPGHSPPAAAIASTEPMPLMSAVARVQAWHLAQDRWRGPQR